METSQNLLERISERESTVDLLPARRPRKWVLTSRNILELTDGSLILGVSMPNGIDYLWKSTNQGQTWDTTSSCNFEGFDPNRVNYPFFSEGIFWQPTSRDLLVLIPVNPGLFPIEDHQISSMDLNQTERLVVFRSKDLGRTWQKEKELNDGYSNVVYPGIIRLSGGKLLLTYTVMGFEEPLGLQVVLGKERPFGFDFDFQYNRLILNGNTSRRQGINGGFGNTLQFGIDKLITTYSYRGIDGKTHLEIVKWIIPVTRRVSADF